MKTVLKITNMFQQITYLISLIRKNMELTGSRVDLSFYRIQRRRKD